MKFPNDLIQKLIKDILKYGFSALLALSGVILFFLGSVGHAIYPQAFIAGGVIFGLSFIYMISELVIKIIKLKRGLTDEYKQK